MKKRKIIGIVSVITIIIATIIIFIPKNNTPKTVTAYYFDNNGMLVEVGKDGIKKAGMNFQVYTCADVPGYVFDKLFGVVDLYVIRLFSLRPKKHRPYPDYDLNRVLENISFLDRKKVPFRLLIPVLKGTNDTEAEKLALFAASLRSLKSVILDFTHSELNSEEEQNYRAAFLSKGVALY